MINHPLNDETIDKDALNTRHLEMSVGDSKARRYKPIYTTLAGVSEVNAESFSSLGKIVQGRDRVGLCTLQEFSIPQGWHSSAVFAVAQMVCEELVEVKYHDVVVLNDDDIPLMVFGLVSKMVAGW